MKKLHTKIKHDRIVHAKLEQRYLRLKKEFDALKRSKHKKPHHIRKLYYKAHILHKDAVKHDHPFLDKLIARFKSGIAKAGSEIKVEGEKAGTYLAQKYREAKYKRAHKEELAMKAKIERSRAEAVEAEKAELID